MKTITVVLASLVAIGGCGIEGPAPRDDERPLPAPMVSAERAGARVNIYQLTAGQLAVVVTGDMPEDVEGKTPVELYEAIAAAPAPAALVDSQARIAAVRAQRPTDHVGSRADDAAPARSKDATLTASDFQSAHCSPGVVDFDYCYTNVTNNYVTWFYNIHWIHAHVNVYRGSLTHAMWYRGFAGSFHLINVETVTGSTFVSVFDEGDNGDYEISITDATGDGYHLALHGDL